MHDVDRDFDTKLHNINMLLLYHTIRSNNKMNDIKETKLKIKFIVILCIHKIKSCAAKNSFSNLPCGPFPLITATKNTSEDNVIKYTNTISR